MIIIVIILHFRLIVIVYIIMYPVIAGSPYIINIACDIQVEIQMQLILQLDKVLDVYNYSLCALLLDDCSFTGEPKYVAQQTSTYYTNIVIVDSSLFTFKYSVANQSRHQH